MLWHSLSFIKTTDNNMAATFPLPPKNEKSVEEKLAELESLPLFMKDLPDDPSDDPVISALQSLAHEGTPDGGHISATTSSLVDWVLSRFAEIALNFKEQGNTYFKGKRWREAAGFYTQGIDVKPTDKALLEALHINRAACDLELGKRFHPGLAGFQTFAQRIMARFYGTAQPP